MDSFTFSKSEEELMDYIWSQSEPVSILDIAEHWEDKDWTPHYMRFLVKGLEEKGAVECCGVQRRGRQYSRCFRPLLSKEEYYARLVQGRGISARDLVRGEAAALIKTGSKEDMRELISGLEEMVREFRESIEAGE